MNKNLLKAYEIDASQMRGKAADVVTPSTIGEVMKLVSMNKRIVPRGAGSGLAGGCVPQNGQDVVMDLSKLINIGNFDKERLTIEVEAGVVLDELQAYVAQFGLEFPVDPSSHSIATIGGMIATDAVGHRAVKYGKTSSWVKWVEIVDCHGNLDRKGVTELSDYTGLEGVTGIIIKACLKLSPLKKRTASLVKVNSYSEVISIVHDLKRNSSVSMIEFLGKNASIALELGGEYHLIVEYEDDSGGVSGEEYEKLMLLRNTIYPIFAGEGYTRIEDPKVILDRSDKLIAWLEEKKIPVFGHIGVGIFHPMFNRDQEKYIPEMMKLVKRLGGQVSGEHGIGVLKRGFVEINDQKILRNVKKRTDPLNKFNVGKII